MEQNPSNNKFNSSGYNFFVSSVDRLSDQLVFQDKKTNIHKPKIQNTIKFKTLNLAFGFGLLCSALLHLTLMQFESKDTYIVHYSVSIVFNTMLGSFIYANEDTLTFMKLK